MPEPAEIVDFWFRQTPADKHFKKDVGFDQEIRDRFADTYRAAAAGALDHWMATPEGCLALVIVLDQFPRNMFRDSPEAFATDAKAVAVADHAIAQGFDQGRGSRQRVFLYLPYQHSENVDHQRRSVELAARLDGESKSLGYAERHRETIARFGRFPHRNAVLGRETSPEEAEFLSQPASSF